jgi:hypothetical protein
MDGATDLFLIGADRLKTCLLNGGSDNLFEHRIEIGYTPGSVGLPPERHEHEAQRRRPI